MSADRADEENLKATSFTKGEWIQNEPITLAMDTTRKEDEHDPPAINSRTCTGRSSFERRIRRRAERFGPEEMERGSGGEAAAAERRDVERSDDDEASFCVAQRSAAEENGVYMLRKGGHRPRDARAFLSVCGLTVTSQKATTIIPYHTQRKERPSFT